MWHNEYMKRIFFALFFLLFLIYPLPLFAQEQSGISVTPSILHIDLKTEPAEFELIYKNNSKSDISLELSANDFSELEDGWKVRFLNDEESKNYHYSLASWIEFERKSLSLKPGEEGRAKVIINKEELSAGGHYATIMATISALEESGQQVDIKGLLSTVLFVRAATGQEIEQASISDVSFERASFFQFPTVFVMRFNNQGNTELVPYGSLEVKDMFDRTVAKGILNEGSNYSLPESIKRFEIKTKSLESFFVPGIYKVQMDVTYGGTGNLKYESTFVYLNILSLGTVLIILILIGFGFRFLVKSKSHLKK
jgi:hypothetical protein